MHTNNKILLIALLYSCYVHPMVRGFRAAARTMVRPATQKIVDEIPKKIVEAATKKVTEKASIGIATNITLATAAAAAVIGARTVPTTRTAASIIAPEAMLMRPPELSTTSSNATPSISSSSETTSATAKSFLNELWKEGWEAKAVITSGSLVASYLSAKTYNAIRNQLSPLARAQLDTLKISHESTKAPLLDTEKNKTKELANLKQLENNNDDALREKTAAATNAYFNYCQVNNFDINTTTLPQEGDRLKLAMLLHMTLLKLREPGK